MNTRIFLPPVQHRAGGMTVLLQVGAHLHQAGFPVAFVSRDKLYGRGDMRDAVDGSEQVDVLNWEENTLRPEDIWLVPEGWVNGLAPGLNAGARCVVYCQNWAFLFSSLPEGVTWNKLPVHFLSVSEPVRRFVLEATGRESAVLPPGLDIGTLCPVDKPEDRIVIGFMPRKNRAQILQIRQLFETRRERSAPGLPVEWQEISGQDHKGVAELLGRCHVFLGVGFPEGFSLPPLEAMACGALPVGFAGFGGWEYMTQAWPELPGAAAPWWKEADPQKGVGNGVWVADGDVLAAALALEQAIGCIERREPVLESILGAGRETVARYTLDRQREAIVRLWSQARDQRLFT